MLEVSILQFNHRVTCSSQDLSMNPNSCFSYEPDSLNSGKTLMSQCPSFIKWWPLYFRIKHLFGFSWLLLAMTHQMRHKLLHIQSSTSFQYVFLNFFLYFHFLLHDLRWPNYFNHFCFIDTPFGFRARRSLTLNILHFTRASVTH